MTTCDLQMRDGLCELDPDHRGRHTTVAFYCDGCGKRRRGQPVGYLLNQWDGVPEGALCFMCMRGLT